MPDPNDLLVRARRILRSVPLIDGHNDLPWQFRRLNKDPDEINLTANTGKLDPPLLTDIPRLRVGGVGAQFWSAYVPSNPPGPAAVVAVLEQIDLIHRLAGCYPKDFAMAFCVRDIQRIHRQGRIACLIGMEGGHSIVNSLAVLRATYALGARYMTLTHIKSNDWADAAGDRPRHHGLSPFGEEVIREMNRLGMLVDLSHVTDETMHAALRISKSPVIFSHSSARSVCHNARNVPDDILRLVRDNGGIVMACFLPGYLNDEASAHFALAMAEKERVDQRYPDDPHRVETEMELWCSLHPAPRASLNDVANHIDHLRDVTGIDHVGLGSDFEGYHGTVEGLEDVSCYPALFAELLRRGYSHRDLKKIAGLNFLRVFRQAESLAATFRTTAPSGPVFRG
jgi:membrane dipeptidase